MKNELHSALNQNLQPESKLQLYNHILNKNIQPSHPIIPKQESDENISEEIKKDPEEIENFDIKNFINLLIKKKPLIKRKPRGQATPVSNSITKKSARTTRLQHKKSKETPIKSLDLNETIEEEQRSPTKKFEEYSA